MASRKGQAIDPERAEWEAYRALREMERAEEDKKSYRHAPAPSHRRSVKDSGTVGSGAGLWEDDGMLDLSVRPTFSDDLVDGLIPQVGVGLFTGTSGAFKTFNGLRACVSLGVEETFIGRKIERPGGSVYLGYEGYETIQARMTAIFDDIQYSGNNPPIFIPKTPMRFNQRGAYERLALSLEGVKRRFYDEYDAPLVFCCIDTVVAAGLVADEMDPVQWQDAFTSLGDIASELRMAIALVAHAGKDASKGARGSSGNYAAADFELTFSAAQDRITGDTTGRLVSLTKNRDGQSMPLAAMSGRKVYVGDTETGKRRYSIVVDYDTDQEAVSNAISEQTAAITGRSARKAKGEHDKPRPRKETPSQITARERRETAIKVIIENCVESGGGADGSAWWKIGVIEAEAMLRGTDQGRSMKNNYKRPLERMTANGELHKDEVDNHYTLTLPKAPAFMSWSNGPRS